MIHPFSERVQNQVSMGHIFEFELLQGLQSEELLQEKVGDSRFCVIRKVLYPSYLVFVDALATNQRELRLNCSQLICTSSESGEITSVKAGGFACLASSGCPPHFFLPVGCPELAAVPQIRGSYECRPSGVKACFLKRPLG